MKWPKSKSRKRRMKNNLGYFMERFTPYFIAFIVIVLMVWKKLDYSDSKEMDNALNSVITMCALIIGFMGAVIPVILGMKNESKIVKYVFEKDKDRLFLKYNKAAILIGILAVVVTVVLYFRDSFLANIRKNLFYTWGFLIILFLCLTYRCLNYMLELIFMDDSSLESPYYLSRSKNESEEMKQFEEEFSIGNKGNKD